MTRIHPRLRYKDLLCLVVLILIVLGFGVQARLSMAAGAERPAMNLDLTPEELQWVKDHPVIHLGVDPEFAPFEFIDDSGAYRGLAADYLELLADSLGLEFKVAAGLTWSEAVERAKNRELDALPCVGQTEERKKHFLFTKPYLSFPRVVYSRRGGPQPKSMADLEGLLIGVQDNSSHQGWLKDNTAFTPIVFSTARDALLALFNGDVDAVVGNLAAGNYTIHDLKLSSITVAFHPPGGAQDMSFAVRKDWPELVSILDKAVAATPAEQSGRIRRAWTNPGTAEDGGEAALWLTQREKDWLSAHPDINVAVMDSWPPLNMIGAHGEPTGIGADYLRLLSRRLGLSINIVSGAFASNLEAARDKQIDALMDVTPKPDREEFLNFTRPYLIVPHVIVGRSSGAGYDNEERLRGKTLALEKGFGNVKYFHDNYPDVRIVEYPNTAACLLAVSRGEADAYAGNRAVTTYIIAQELLTNLRVQGTLRKKGAALTIGVRKDWPELADILDKALQSVTDVEKQTVLRRWTGGAFPAQRVTLTAEEEKWVSDHPTIRVAGLTDFPPFDYQDENGAYSGIAVDILQAVAERIGLQVKPEFGSWTEGLEALRDKRLDLLPEVVDTPERREYLAFTKPFLIVPHVLVVKRNSPVRSINDLTGKRLALEKDYYTSAFIKKRLPQVKITEVDNTLDALLAVSTGAADAYLGNISLVNYLIEENHLPRLDTLPLTELGPLKLCMGVRKDWAPLIPILEKGLDSLTTAERRVINRRYIPLIETAGEQLVLTEAEKAWLEEHPVLRLGAVRDWPPFDYSDKGEEHSGISSEYAHWLDQTLGIKLMPRTDMSWPQILEAARNQEIDVISSITRTKERETYLIFTRPYINAPLVIITRNDAAYLENLDMLANRTVAVVRGYAIQSYLERDYPHLRLVLNDTPAGALKAVSDGRADAAVENTAVFNYLTNHLGLENLKVAAPTPYTFDLAFGVRKDMPELVTILDKALANIPETDKAVFQERWVNIRVERQIDWQAVRRIVFTTIGAAVVILVVIVWWNRRLAREVKERILAEQTVQAMSSAVHDALIMIDAEARIMFWNHAAEALFGVSAEEVRGQNLHQVFAPEEFREQARVGLDVFSKTGQGPVVGKLQEMEALRADGTRFPVEVTVSAFQVEQVWFSVGTVRDITERRRMEDALKESEKQYRMMAEKVNDVIWILDLNERLFRYVSPSVERLRGFTSEETLDQSFEETLVPDSLNQFQEVLPERIAVFKDGDDRAWVDELELLRKDGTTVWTETVSQFVINEETGHLEVYGLARDITERKWAEDELRATKEQLQYIMDTSPVGVAFSTQGMVHFANPQFIEMFGIGPGDLMPELHVNPEDRRVIDETMEREGVVANYEAQMYNASKEPRDMLVTYLPINYYGENGVLGWLLDITERKQAELELMRNLEELERFSRLVVGREEKMVSLKEEVNQLLTEAGRARKYKIVE